MRDHRRVRYLGRQTWEREGFRSGYPPNPRREGRERDDPRAGDQEPRSDVDVVHAGKVTPGPAPALP